VVGQVVTIHNHQDKKPNPVDLVVAAVMDYQLLVLETLHQLHHHRVIQVVLDKVVAAAEEEVAQVVLPITLDIEMEVLVETEHQILLLLVQPIQ
jgi:hypothetical protein